MVVLNGKQVSWKKKKKMPVCLYFSFFLFFLPPFPLNPLDLMDKYKHITPCVCVCAVWRGMFQAEAHVIM